MTQYEQTDHITPHPGWTHKPTDPGMSVDEFGKLYGTLFERVPKDRVTPTGLNDARYYDEEFNRDSSDIEVFIGIREKEKADIIMEPCECAMTIYHGGYSTLSEAYGAVVS